MEVSANQQSEMADMLGCARELRANADADTSSLPWRQIIGLRNILAQGYVRIDQETLSRTAAAELAAVEHELMAGLATRGRD